MSVSTLLTFAEFEQLPEDECKHELLEGEHLMSPPPKIRHSKIARRLIRTLASHETERGTVYETAGFKLGKTTWLQPDVSFVTNEQDGRANPDGYWEGGPMLVIEVISESNTAREIDRKISVLFEHGTEEIWVVYPDSRSIWVYRRGESGATRYTEELRTPVFPELRLDVKGLFEQA
jgi:Uma2 family endonuclease